MQKKDGSWDEPQYTGTGFPRVFYLAYHLYRNYFPMLALATYARVFGNIENPRKVVRTVVRVEEF